MNIFISGLSFRARKEDLANLFAPYGDVVTSRIIVDKEKRKSKGYGFVEMTTIEEGEAAIKALNGTEHMGRTIKVTQAHDRPEKRVSPNYF